MESTGVKIIRMTGAELRRIQDASGLTQLEFAEKKLKVSRTQLNRLFDLQEIPEGVEARIDTDKELGHLKNTLLNKAPSVPDTGGSEVVKYLTDTMQLLKDVLVKGEKQSEVLQKMADTLIDSNQHIREEAIMYRRMFADAYDSGLLKWTNPGK